MTPKRKKYLKRCSEREKYLHKEIKDYKREIKAIKSSLQTGCDVEFNLGCLKFRKLWLTMYRHELARIKGMDRVVVPKVVSYKEFEGVCKCGNDVTDFDIYCSECGRKLLWEKVK